MHIKQYIDKTVLNHEMAKKIIRIAKLAIKDHGFFGIALSGGSSPIKLYSLLATEYKSSFPWEKTLFFLVDERYVKLTHKNSNYNQAMKLIFSKLEINYNLFPIYQNGLNYWEAAIAYENIIKQKLFKVDNSFDLIILGTGSDGHTASLFPKSDILNERNKLISTTIAPHYAIVSKRVSFTYPLINKAKNIFTIILGENKRSIYSSIVNNETKYPIENVKRDNSLVIYTDLL